MSAAQLDASRRMADVKRMIAYQTLLKSELRTNGLPAEGAERLIDILQCCLLVIEATQVADEEDLNASPPRLAAGKAA
jgi:hypothetical protein